MRNVSTLARLREDIDRIDDQILDLLQARLTVCRQIADAKPADGGLKLCPDRQRAVVARLEAKATPAAAPAVAHVWREIMSHAVQAQATTPILIVTRDDRERLLRLVRDAYGSAAPIEWAASEERALARAAREDVVLVLGGAIGPMLPTGLSRFDQLRDEQGVIVARLVGRVGVPLLPRATTGWWPDGWRARKAEQQPTYPNLRELQRVERRLASRAPLVELHDIDALKERLAAAARGEAVLVQGGDCVETLREHSPEKVRATAALLREIGDLVGAADVPAVLVGRMAGQSAKPRSSATEVVNGVEISVYRGDGVNGEEAELPSRLADPQRLLAVHDMAAETLRHVWGTGAADEAPVYASHEALLLNVEQAQTRYDERTGRWWAGSGHLLWIGERTRQLDGAHVDYMRGIANPIGLKCGPTMTVDDLLRLLDRLDPAGEAGRMTLIPRMGRERVGERLPALMRAVKQAGRNVLWCVDPMHGNTRVVDGRKVRLVDDILAETQAFHEVTASEGVWAGGVHLELTGSDVLECRGSSRRRWLGLGPRAPYLTGCDPRLNREQALEVAAAVARWTAPTAARRVG